ncbi:MAG: LacI family transcriptional regulator [Propionibacteriaceae bacterium]|nr:LacI family transcriptional regulator [Propionibacteriaceae bacterium]
MGPVTIRDVAAQAGVSVGTASRVLNGHPSTSARSRQRVDQAARSLGYQANARARSLRRSRTDTIGVLVSDITNPFFAEIAQAVEQRALASGLSTVLCNANESVEQQDRYLELLVRQRVDGIVIAPQGDGSGHLAELDRYGIPFVFVDRVIDGVDVPSVTSDNTLGLAEAVELLAGLGHRRVGYVAGPQQTSTGRQRLTAFRTAAAAASFDSHPALVFQGDFRLESGRAGAAALLSLADPPTAVIAADSLMTLGVAFACRERQVRIGSELSLIGYDDMTAFALMDPPLTVIAHDPFRMGQLAFDLISEAMAGRVVGSTVLPSSLIQRGSVGPCPEGGPE